MADMDMAGFNVLKDMSDDELVEEIISHQRKELSKQKRQQLMEIVIQMRLCNYKERLKTESGIQWGMTGLMGLFGSDE